MSIIDPGKLPLKQILNEAHRREAESEVRAELVSAALAERKKSRSSRGVRGILGRMRRAVKG